MLEVRRRPSKHGAWLVMPLAGRLSIGVTSESDWVVEATTGLRRAILLACVDGKVRVDPCGERTVSVNGGRIAEAVLAEAPFKFSIGKLQFEVGHARRSPQPVDARLAGAAADAGFRGVLDDVIVEPEARKVPAKRRGKVFPPVALTLLVGAAVAGGAVAVIVPTQSAPSLPVTAPARPSLYAAPLVAAPAPMPMQSDQTEATVASRVAGAPPARRLEDPLHVRMENLLQAGAFSTEIRVVVSNGRVTVAGQADAEEIARLRRILAREARLDPRMAEIGLKVDPLDAAPPFKIQQIVAGESPYVVLSDGTRLQTGGQHSGYRVVAIEAGKVTLQGSRRIEVVW